jgi:hypothetical protein
MGVTLKSGKKKTLVDRYRDVWFLACFNECIDTNLCAQSIITWKLHKLFPFCMSQEKGNVLTHKMLFVGIYGYGTFF